MGKLFNFRSNNSIGDSSKTALGHPHKSQLPPATTTSSLRPAAAGKIVKRTSHFLQKKMAKLTHQAHYLQQRQQQSGQHHTVTCHSSSPSSRSSSSSSISSLLAPTSFTLSSSTTAADHSLGPFSLFSSSSSSAGAAYDSDNHASYQLFRQDYDQFLDTHNLRQEWPRNWKDSLEPHHFETMCLTASQLQFQELLYEVILTEKTYVDDLALAYKIFAKDALASSQLPKSVRLIFDNLLQIVRLHLGLFQDLRGRQNSQHPIVRTIADLFLGYAPRFLDYYSAYFINFENANDVVVRSMNSKTDALGIYLRTRSSWPECRNLTLQSFLLKPVQRLMKYPLFFKSLSESLCHDDVDRIDHLRTLHELKLSIHKIEVDKKENEDFKKLEDLDARIGGLSGDLATPGRRLVYEGYLTLVPAFQAPLMRSITTDSLGGQQYTYKPHPNVNRPRGNSFSLNSSSKSVYVFLFNDMILCTKVRSKTRVLDDGIKPGNYYGPNPYALFKLVQSPGQLTFVDRSVSRLVSKESKDDQGIQHQGGSRTSLRFASLRRSRSNHTSIYPITVDDQSQEYEEHPQQFVCSIATRHITNYHFETASAEDKKAWCEKMESVLETHVQRPDWWNDRHHRQNSHHQQHHFQLYQNGINSSAFLGVNNVSNVAFSIRSLAAQHTLGLGSMEQADADISLPLSSEHTYPVQPYPPTQLIPNTNQNDSTGVNNIDDSNNDHDDDAMDMDMDIQRDDSRMEQQGLAAAPSVHPVQFSEYQRHTDSVSSSRSSSSSSSIGGINGVDDQDEGDTHSTTLEAFTTAVSSPASGIFYHQRVRKEKSANFEQHRGCSKFSGYSME